MPFFPPPPAPPVVIRFSHATARVPAPAPVSGIDQLRDDLAAARGVIARQAREIRRLRREDDPR